MIIDTHVWLSRPDSWGDLTMMDDAMITAGWTEIGEKTGLAQGMSGEEMVARMDEAGVDKAISHAIKMPHLNVHVPSEFVAAEVAKFPDRLIGMSSVDLLGGLPALREMEDIAAMGLIGMKITPAPDYDMNLNDERIMPIYEKAEELGDDDPGPHRLGRIRAVEPAASPVFG